MIKKNCNCKQKLLLTRMQIGVEQSGTGQSRQGEQSMLCFNLQFPFRAHANRFTLCSDHFNVWSILYVSHNQLHQAGKKTKETQRNLVNSHYKTNFKVKPPIKNYICMLTFPAF